MTTEHAISIGALALAHKMIHPYLRFGVLLCKGPRTALPGRLVRQGAHIDFIAAWSTKTPDTAEMEAFARLIGEEVRASRLLPTSSRTNTATVAFIPRCCTAASTCTEPGAVARGQAVRRAPLAVSVTAVCSDSRTRTAASA